jgi:uncharacterized protein (TIGR02145 family)
MCPDCCEAQGKGLGLLIGLICLGLFWQLPKFIYRKTGKLGLIIYIAILIISGIWGYHAIEKWIAGDCIFCEEKSTGKVKSDTSTEVSSDAYEYTKVKIGNQTWMAENLNIATPTGSKCYDNKPANCKKYGRLYTWSMAKKICPEGWHLPSDEEWQILIDIAGGDKIAGKKLKAKEVWKDGTDDFYFAALPGGIAVSDNDFRFAGKGGVWWSATEDGAQYAYYRSMEMNDTGIPKGNGNKNALSSIRCIEDKTAMNTTMEDIFGNVKPGIVTRITGAAVSCANPNGCVGTATNEGDGNPIAELEQEAEKWRDGNTYKSNDGTFFSFKATKKKDEEGITTRIWTATSKVKIENCPAKSVWEMKEGCLDPAFCGASNKVPAKCKSITPKIITDYDSNAGEFGEGG